CKRPQSPDFPLAQEIRRAAPSKRFGSAKTLPQAEFISAEEVRSKGVPAGWNIPRGCKPGSEARRAELELRL
ncbi:hypothetical protein, partial [Intestinimonas butyriciproducens]|uniref:hypothetical protein n=1 Tax=Intestinimonas butyriciproducens TaxID=1297617 RepID=UPI0031B60D82